MGYRSMLGATLCLYIIWIFFGSQGCADSDLPAIVGLRGQVVKDIGSAAGVTTHTRLLHRCDGWRGWLSNTGDSLLLCSTVLLGAVAPWARLGVCFLCLLAFLRVLLYIHASVWNCVDHPFCEYQIYSPIPV